MTGDVDALVCVDQIRGDYHKGSPSWSSGSLRPSAKKSSGSAARRSKDSPRSVGILGRMTLSPGRRISTSLPLVSAARIQRRFPDYPSGKRSRISTHRCRFPGQVRDQTRPVIGQGQGDFCQKIHQPAGLFVRLLVYLFPAIA